MYKGAQAMKNIKTTLKLFEILIVLAGIIYPVAVTVLAQFGFPGEQHINVLELNLALDNMK